MTFAFSRGYGIRTASHEPQSAASPEGRVLRAVVPAGLRLLVTLCARPARALGTPHSWFSLASYPGGRLESFTSRLEAGFLGRNLMPSRELPAFRSSRGDLVPGDPLAFRRVAGGDHLAAVGHPGVPCACPPGPGPTSGHPEGKPRVGGAGRGGEGRRGLCSSPMWHQKGRLRAQQRPAPQASLAARPACWRPAPTRPSRACGSLGPRGVACGPAC